MDQANVVSYFHADGLGSITKMTDSAGAVVHTRQYDAWGNMEQGADQPGYAFTGREWNPETDLYYYRARYYDPQVGRFSSEDPIGAKGGINYYLYSGNRPTTSFDPFGLTEWKCSFEFMSIWMGGWIRASCVSDCKRGFKLGVDIKEKGGAGFSVSPMPTAIFMPTVVLTDKRNEPSETAFSGSWSVLLGPGISSPLTDGYSIGRLTIGEAAGSITGSEEGWDLTLAGYFFGSVAYERTSRCGCAPNDGCTFP
jgi:RHS repeat-associated protein